MQPPNSLQHVNVDPLILQRFLFGGLHWVQSLQRPRMAFWVLISWFMVFLRIKLSSSNNDIFLSLLLLLVIELFIQKVKMHVLWRIFWQRFIDLRGENCICWSWCWRYDLKHRYIIVFIFAWGNSMLVHLFSRCRHCFSCEIYVFPKQGVLPFYGGTNKYPPAPPFIEKLPKR